MASAMVDAALAVSGWRGSWDQGMFGGPLCLGDREREVAELTGRCLRRYGERLTQVEMQSLDVGGTTLRKHCLFWSVRLTAIQHRVEHPSSAPSRS